MEGKFKHVDNHAVAFDTHDPNFVLVGCDGGLYESRDLCATWHFVANLPVTQFYKVALDNDLPFYNVYRGAQDNNTLGGPSRTDKVHGINNSDWFVTSGGDGYMPATDPDEPNIVYSESQNGNVVRFDRKTGESVFIQPQPAKGEPEERFGWDAPIVVSPHGGKTLFFASQRVWRSDDRGDSWRTLSGDLTRGIDRLHLALMGRVWSFDAMWDLLAMAKYSTITALDQSPLDAQLLVAGTDDGLIQVTEDGGAHWRKTRTPACRREGPVLRQRREGRPPRQEHALRRRGPAQDRRRGEIVIDRALGHAKGNGPDDPPGASKVLCTPETPFSLMSASKPMTAMLIHLLDQKDCLRLDDPVAEYIPEFGSHGKKWITIRHILAHRAGIPASRCAPAPWSC